MAPSLQVQETLCASIKPYHVFISHRGADTKKTLASTIYHSFNESGLNVFFDLEEFKAGQKVAPTIAEAISSSSVQLVILSPNYAGSKWCLEELRFMHNILEDKSRRSGKMIAVFDGVTHEDLQTLRFGKGKYAGAFEIYKKRVAGNEKRYDLKRIEEWREALEKVCNISGTELNAQKFNGDWGKLVYDIKRQVMEHLRTVRIKSVDGLLGLDKAFDELKILADYNKEQRENVKIVGIVGPPGSGKKTLAEEFYYRERSSYDRSSLLLGVREASKQNGLPALQSKLLKDLTNDCLPISNVSEGKDILADRVRRLCHTKSWKFLIVIDDVDRQDQLEALLIDVLSSVSLVIVTSRNKAVLKLSGISLYYKTKPLGLADAEELLCRSAFHKPQPTKGFEDLVQTVLTKCVRFPEFLKSLGSNLHLYGNNEREDWEYELQMMIPHIFKDICGGLEEEERQIFLDIACFYNKMEKNSAIRVWAGSGWRGARALQNLEYLCLVDDDVDNAPNCLSMPEYLLDLGQEIADQRLRKASDLPCRLWHSNAAASFLKEPPLQEGAKIRGTREASHKQLSEMTTEELFKVELLDVSGDISYDTFSDRLRNLVWLRWKNCPETPILPPEMNNLRVFELVNGDLETLAPDIKLPVDLREISVIECTRLAQIPPTIGFLNHLEKMTLDSTISVKSLPLEFCQLQALKHLVLRNCESLESLPEDFGNLKNLQYIDFSHCRRLSSLPPSFRQLTQLKTLDVSNCVKLIIQEDIFEQIRSIEELTMENCTELKMLPTEMTLQGLLRKLNLLGTSLKELPDDIDKLINLQHLNIGSPFLRSLPSSLKNLHSLVEFQLVNCTLLTSYPQSYGPTLLLKSPQIQSQDNLVTNSYVYGRP